MPRRLTLVLVLVLLSTFFATVVYPYYWIHRFDRQIALAASAYGLDSELVWAVVYEESYFNPHARSSAGAYGLMQVTEPVYDEWLLEEGYRSIPSRPTRTVRRVAVGPERTLDDPGYNLHIGCWYLAKQMNRFEREPDALAVALAAYNAGPTNAERWLRASQPAVAMGSDRREAFIGAIDYPETKNYVRAVLGRYRLLAEA